GLTPERFVHDPAGNLIGMNEDGGGQVKGDRLVLLGDRHFRYDAAGNLTEERRGKAGRLTTRYAYDSDNRLVRAETPDGVSQYRYDPLGRRIAKVTPEGETRFVYDGARLLQETWAERCRTYLFEPGGFRPLACIDQAGGAASQVYYYHLDHLGTPRELTDTTGKIVWSARYRAYGSLALADVADIDNPLRFQGQYFDAETGLHYNLNRYYDPQAGRFINQDPIGLAGGVNLFQYAVNPVNWIDPLGLKCGEGLTGNNWEFNPQKDVDLRGTTKTYRDALDEAFKRTGIPKEEFEVSRWAKDQYGKSIPVEWQGPGGANVNMDIPAWNNVKPNGALGEGPHAPHIGYQTPGKPRTRGHIFIDDVPATRR
ncbi:MAG: polymorphic toxin type 47 domain-containing protein, partial [Methylobacter sp.]|uniref:polymorphic toxin type 47 domain-containing protein n=1 Tax=Methylobacter sp. TaxID=2051955 RepID=UPI00258A80F3